MIDLLFSQRHAICNLINDEIAKIVDENEDWVTMHKTHLYFHAINRLGLFDEDKINDFLLNNSQPQIIKEKDTHE